MATYDMNKIFLLVGGQRVTGAGDGDFVSIEWNSDRYESTVGADGTHVRSRLNDNSAMATISLMYGGNGNPLLDGFRRKDDDSGGGEFAFSMIDIESGTEIVSTTAWIEAMPGPAIGRTVPALEWKARLKDAGAVFGALPGI
jgi:hypothetical protein